MRKTFGLALFALLITAGMPSLSVAAPMCKTGIPCGNSCIAKDKVCHIKAAPSCKKGKPCGDSCIAADKICRQ